MKYGWDTKRIRVNGQTWRVRWSPRGYWVASKKGTVVYSSDVRAGVTGNYPDMLVELAFEELQKKLKE